MVPALKGMAGHPRELTAAAHNPREGLLLEGRDPSGDETQYLPSAVLERLAQASLGGESAWELRQSPHPPRASPTVLAKTAEQLGCDVDALGVYLAREPWNHDSVLEANDFRKPGEGPSADWLRDNPSPTFRKKTGLDGFEKTGLAPPEVAALLHHSRAVIGAGEAIRRAPEFRDGLAPDEEGQVGYVLAVTHLKNYSAYQFANRVAARFWHDGYPRYFGDCLRARTREYMGLITASGEPVYYLLPPNLATRTGNTRDEYDWLQENPHRMRSVVFVLDGYSAARPRKRASEADSLARE